jgi:hypothetical protein
MAHELGPANSRDGYARGTDGAFENSRAGMGHEEAGLLCVFNN